MTTVYRLEVQLEESPFAPEKNTWKRKPSASAQFSSAPQFPFSSRSAQVFNSLRHRRR